MTKVVARNLELDHQVLDYMNEHHFTLNDIREYTVVRRAGDVVRIVVDFYAQLPENNEAPQ